MPIIKKLLKLPKAKYFEVHLSLINCVLPKKLTPMEIKVMAAFMGLEGDIAQHRFGPTARKMVMSTINPEKPLSPAGLSNYIGQLTEKGFLIEKGDIIEILPILIPETTEQIYSFKLENLN